MLVNNTALVLEGGGLRGMYTAGVLEYFMTQSLYFKYNIGVSAGCSVAASYISRQPGRTRTANVDYVRDKRFLSIGNYIKNQEFLGMDFIYHTIPNELVPFDMDTFLKSEEDLVIVATDAHTAHPIYYKKSDIKEDIMTALRASSALPFMTQPVHFKGYTLYDGGIVDPIPYRRAMTDGYDKQIVILTRPVGYRKRERRHLMKLRRYPEVNKALSKRARLYNDTLDALEQRVTSNNAYIIQPSVDLKVDRMEKDQRKLLKLYQLGYEDAKRHHKTLLDFIYEHEQIEKHIK